MLSRALNKYAQNMHQILTHIKPTHIVTFYGTTVTYTRYLCLAIIMCVLLYSSVFYIAKLTQYIPQRGGREGEEEGRGKGEGGRRGRER